jgi:hypothetical protein
MVFLFFLAPVPPRAQLPVPLAGNSGTTTASLGQGSLMTAYGQITTTTSNQPGALANFGFTQNGILTTEAGVAASTPTTTEQQLLGSDRDNWTIANMLDNVTG